MLAAIYNVFDGEELLEGSINQIRDHVDVIILVSQTVSNHGNRYDAGYDQCERLKGNGVVEHHIHYIPTLGRMPSINETAKRNLGLELAKKLNCTHFISMDCDEYYDSKEFKNTFDQIIEHGIQNTYVPLKTYFGTPEFQITPDEKYYVPFICELNKNTKVGAHVFGSVYCDPTRKPNSKGKPVMMDLYMHHYSWIRKSIERKIDNSSANVNLKHSRHDLIKACKNPSEGMEIPFYKGHTLKKVEDHFNIKGVF